MQDCLVHLSKSCLRHYQLRNRFTYFDEVERLKMDFAEKQLQLQWKEKLSDVNRILILMEKVVEETEKDMEGKDCSEARAKFHNSRPCRDFAFSTLSDDFETIFSPWRKVSGWKINWNRMISLILLVSLWDWARVPNWVFHKLTSIVWSWICSLGLPIVRRWRLF